MCFENYVNYWFDIFIEKSSESEIDTKNFLDISE